MTVSNRFFMRAGEYQNERERILDEYEARMKELAKAKGSRLYNDESKKASQKKERELAALKKTYREYMEGLIYKMRLVNERRSMQAPTEEQLRILSMLKMKDSYSKAELNAAANALKDNASCLAILKEISDRSGQTTSYIRGLVAESTAASMPLDITEKNIAGLEAGVKEMIEFDTPKPARIYSRFREINYGDSPDLPRKGKQFDTKEECFKKLGGLTGNELKTFCSIIDEG